MSAPGITNRKSQITNAKRTQSPKPIEQWQRSRLFGYWKDVSASFAFEAASEEPDPDQAARLAYASQKLGRPVLSWSGCDKKPGGLTKLEAGRLIHAMRADLARGGAPSLSSSPGRAPLGPTAKPDALEIIANLAIDLYGSADWGEALKERLTQRPFFHYGQISEISPWQSHELIEILLNHLEREQHPEESTVKERRQRKEGLRARFLK